MKEIAHENIEVDSNKPLSDMALTPSEKFGYFRDVYGINGIAR